MFDSFKYHTVSCRNEDELENLLRAHYLFFRQGSLSSILRHSYEVKAVMGNILSDSPRIVRYEVSIPLHDWKAMMSRGREADVETQILSGEYQP